MKHRVFVVSWGARLEFAVHNHSLVAAFGLEYLCRLGGRGERYMFVDVSVQVIFGWSGGLRVRDHYQWKRPQ